MTATRNCLCWERVAATHSLPKNGADTSDLLIAFSRLEISHVAVFWLICWFI